MKKKKRKTTPASSRVKNRKEQNNTANEYEFAIIDTDDIVNFFDENANFLIGELVRRTQDIKAHKKPDPIGAFTRDDFERALFLDTTIDVEEPIYDAQNNEVIPEMTTCATTATKQQWLLIKAFREYATMAASYAKYIGSSSINLWARIIDIFDEAATYSDISSQRLSDENAEAILKLEKVASIRLRRDMTIASIPKFNGRKK